MGILIAIIATAATLAATAWLWADVFDRCQSFGRIALVLIATISSMAAGVYAGTMYTKAAAALAEKTKPVFILQLPKQGSI